MARYIIKYFNFKLWCRKRGRITMIGKQNVAQSPHLGRVAALARSRMNDSPPFEKTIKQTTGTMPAAPKTIATATLVEDQ